MNVPAPRAAPERRPGPGRWALTRAAGRARGRARRLRSGRRSPGALGRALRAACSCSHRHSGSAKHQSGLAGRAPSDLPQALKETHHPRGGPTAGDPERAQRRASPPRAEVRPRSGAFFPLRPAQASRALSAPGGYQASFRTGQDPATRAAASRQRPGLAQPPRREERELQPQGAPWAGGQAASQPPPHPPWPGDREETG